MVRGGVGVGRRALLSAALGVLLTVVVGAPASAAIVEPASAPVVVAVPATGTPAAVTVVAGGFTKGALVYVEQCDGVAQTVPQWSPTAHCDLGTSPTPAIADARGFATFASTDENRAFHPVNGESPQSLFNCLAPSQSAPKNGLPSFTNCKLRVSTNNAATTSDQAFLAMAFTTSARATTPTSKVTSKSPTTSSAPASVSTTPTTVRGKAHTSTSRPTAHTSKPKTKPVAVAVVAAPQRSNDVGAFSLSDPTLAWGYILVLVGILLVGLTIALRRRDSARAATVIGTQTVDER